MPSKDITHWATGSTEKSWKTERKPLRFSIKWLSTLIF
jgi:hypothetical protein